MFTPPSGTKRDQSCESRASSRNMEAKTHWFHKLLCESLAGLLLQTTAPAWYDKRQSVITIGSRISHFEVVAKLGEGGMGVVWQARDTNLDRLVALKVLPADKVANPERKRRFVQEAKAASALNHPHIVTIHEISCEDGIDFIVMEYAIQVTQKGGGSPYESVDGRTIYYPFEGLRKVSAGGGEESPVVSPRPRHRPRR